MTTDLQATGEQGEVAPMEAVSEEGLTEQEEQLRDRLVMALRTVYDPEIPVNIYELGLVYEVIINHAQDVHVKMTLTSPACPVAGSLPGEVEDKLRGVDGVREVKVELTWEPPWEPSMMTEEARLDLGFF